MGKLRSKIKHNRGSRKRVGMDIYERAVWLRAVVCCFPTEHLKLGW